MAFMPCHMHERMILIAVVGIVAAVPIPPLVERRRAANEARAVANVQRIATAEVAASASASLKSLAETGAIERDLEDGEVEGYRYELLVAVVGSRTQWRVAAAPSVPGTTGNRSFVTNHTGGVCWTSEAVPASGDCALPAGVLPV